MGRKKPKRSRSGDDETYIELIRNCHSIVDYSPPRNDPHHLQRIGNRNERGTALTNPDRYAVPVTRSQHDACEDDPRGDIEWFRGHDIDALALADALWAAFHRYGRGALKAMDRIILIDVLRRKGNRVAR